MRLSHHETMRLLVYFWPGYIKIMMRLSHSETMNTSPVGVGVYETHEEITSPWEHLIVRYINPPMRFSHLETMRTSHCRGLSWGDYHYVRIGKKSYNWYNKADNEIISSWDHENSSWWGSGYLENIMRRLSHHDIIIV